MSDNNFLTEGLVTAAHGRRGILETCDGDSIGYLTKGKSLRVVCGDRVSWTREDGGNIAIVNNIINRNNVLSRQPQGHRRAEILAANLSMVAVVFAPAPKPDWFLVDRYLCGGALMNCKLLLINNKSDLTEARSDQAMLTEIKVYLAAGYDYLSVSAMRSGTLGPLRDRLDGETAILVGQSGAGKSSIINQLVPDARTAVGEISKSTLEGTHTTTASIMHALKSGGRLIDSPGVREFIPAIEDPRSVQSGYPEILTAAADCRFSNCQHLREPDCGVKRAVASGSVSPRRYESYKRLLRSIQD